MFFSDSIMSDESDLNCFKGHILNEEIDRAKVLYSRKQEEFSRLISQQSKPTYSNLPRDELGTSLIPEDVTGADDCLVALKAKGNGDCLFNSISILLFGDENRSHLLRLLVAGELYFNRSFYADHDAFNDAVASDIDFFPDVLFTVALTRQGDKKFSDTGNREETIKEEAFVACEVRAWSSLVHIMAMSSVLARPIVSMYPSVQFKYRCLVNRVINPRPSATSATPKEPLNILWSRDGNLDNTDGGWYIPNHFVPVVLADERDSDKRPCPSISKDSTPKRKQQGTLFSFLKPKATTVPAEESKGSKRTTSNAGLDNKPDIKKSPSASAALKKKIVLKWKDEFPWLTIRKEDDAVICSVCSQVPKEAGNTQFITGCKSEKKETFQIHATTCSYSPFVSTEACS